MHEATRPKDNCTSQEKMKQEDLLAFNIALMYR